MDPESAPPRSVRRAPQTPPHFDAAFRTMFETLVRWRRDVRRFRPDPVPAQTLEALLALAVQAPSVGLSQPWRFVTVDDPARRRAIRDIFTRCNAEALADYEGSRARLYARLKLAGLDEAPVHLAVFCDEETGTGHGLGQRTMPETRRYSVVTAVHTLWLGARARGLGVGWVSILDPEDVAAVLDVPAAWRLVAYLCIGYPQEESPDPELERHQWERRAGLNDRLLRR